MAALCGSTSPTAARRRGPSRRRATKIIRGRRDGTRYRRRPDRPAYRRERRDASPAIAPVSRGAASQPVLTAPRGAAWVVLDAQHRAGPAPGLGTPHTPPVAVQPLATAEQPIAFVRPNPAGPGVNSSPLHPPRLV